MMPAFLPGTFNSYPKGPKPESFRTAGVLYLTGGYEDTYSPASLPGSSTLSTPDGFVQHYRTTSKTSQGGYKAPSGNTVNRDNKAGGSTIADPWSGHYFKLEINGTEVAHFYECSGIKNSCDPAKIEEGGYNSHVHLRPAPSKWANLVLKYGTCESMFMVEWRNEILSGNFSVRKQYSGAVTLFDNTGAALRKYNFINAWPVSWEGPALNAGSSELAIETIELAHDGIWIGDSA